MTANINITDEPTPYPAPTYYGCDAFGHPTKFYKPEWVEHARQLHDGRKGDNPDKPEFQLQQGPVAFRIVPFDGDVASIPVKGKKTCVVCGEPFTPIVGKQLTCGMRCSYERSKQVKRAYNEKQKAKVS